MAVAAGLHIPLHIPKPAVMPVRRVLPIETVEDRVQAHAFQGNPASPAESEDRTRLKCEVRCPSSSAGSGGALASRPKGCGITDRNLPLAKTAAVGHFRGIEAVGGEFGSPPVAPK